MQGKDGGAHVADQIEGAGLDGLDQIDDLGAGPGDEGLDPRVGGRGGPLSACGRSRLVDSVAEQPVDVLGLREVGRRTWVTAQPIAVQTGEVRVAFDTISLPSGLGGRSADH